MISSVSYLDKGSQKLLNCLFPGIPLLESLIKAFSFIDIQILSADYENLKFYP